MASALGLLSACGGAEGAPAKSASPPREEAPPAEPRTVEEAQKQIALAVDELNGRALKANDERPSQTSPSPPPPAAEPSPKSEYSADSASVNRCESPCRALASMKRAVEALCRMTGETDSKCVDARKTLADNVGKTATCHCG